MSIFCKFVEIDSDKDDLIANLQLKCFLTQNSKTVYMHNSKNNDSVRILNLHSLASFLLSELLLSELIWWKILKSAEVIKQKLRLEWMMNQGVVCDNHALKQSLYL